MSQSGRIGRKPMVLAALLWTVGGHLQAQNPNSTLPPGPPRATMANPYRMVENWPQLGTIKPGAATGILPDGKGGVWLLHRSEPPIVHIDASGTVIKSFGNGMISSGHGFCQDRDGNFWVGDSGAFFDSPKGEPKAYVFHKFSPEGKHLLTFGKPGVSKAGPDTMIMPTACVQMPNGNIMLADGHLPRPSYAQQEGDRLVEITRDGKFVREWGMNGEHGKTPFGTGPGELWSPHALAYDSQGRLFVADRTNNRVQIYDKNMSFLDDWKQFGRPSGLVILKDDTLLVSDSESMYSGFRPAELGPDPNFKGFQATLEAPWSLKGYKGTATALRNLGWQNGIRIGSAKDGSLRQFIPGIKPEGLAGDELGNIYSGLTGTCHPTLPNVNCLQKWVKK